VCESSGGESQAGAPVSSGKSAGSKSRQSAAAAQKFSDAVELFGDLLGAHAEDGRFRVGGERGRPVLAQRRLGAPHGAQVPGPVGPVAAARGGRVGAVETAGERIPADGAFPDGLEHHVGPFPRVIAGAGEQAVPVGLDVQRNPDRHGVHIGRGSVQRHAVVVEDADPPGGAAAGRGELRQDPVEGAPVDDLDVVAVLVVDRRGRVEDGRVGVDGPAVAAGADGDVLQGERPDERGRLVHVDQVLPAFRGVVCGQGLHAGHGLQELGGHLAVGLHAEAGLQLLDR
jgi:hypothetical protein